MKMKPPSEAVVLEVKDGFPNIPYITLYDMYENECVPLSKEDAKWLVKYLSLILKTWKG